MPRKKFDPAADVLTYFTDQPYDVAVVVLGLAKSVMAKRAPKVAAEKPKQRRRQVRKPAVSAAQTAMEEIPVAPAPAVGKLKRRTRRMRADSAPPVNEATPIVPLQEEVGDEAYTGQ